jgi:hypothetical protein
MLILENTENKYISLTIWLLTATLVVVPHR